MGNAPQSKVTLDQRGTIEHPLTVKIEPTEKSALDFALPILTPLIAIIATYVAYQQWSTNRQKLKLDHYDKRYRIYEEVNKIFRLIVGNADISIADLSNFYRNTIENSFLFGPEITAYIEEIHERGIKLRTANSQYCDYNTTPPPGYDHNKVVDQMHEQLTWFIEQFDVAREKFKKYLDLRKL